MKFWWVYRVHSNNYYAGNTIIIFIVQPLFLAPAPYLVANSLLGGIILRPLLGHENEMPTTKTLYYHVPFLRDGKNKNDMKRSGRVGETGFPHSAREYCRTHSVLTTCMSLLGELAQNPEHPN